MTETQDAAAFAKHELTEHLVNTVARAALMAYTVLIGGNIEGFSFGCKAELSFINGDGHEVFVNDDYTYSINDADGTELATNIEPSRERVLVLHASDQAEPTRLPDALLELGREALFQANCVMLSAGVEYSDLQLSFDNTANGTNIEIGADFFFSVYYNDEEIDGSELRAPMDATDVSSDRVDTPVAA